MSQSSVSALPKFAGVVLAIGCTFVGPGWADPIAQMLQCRLLTDVALKAACYDAIALPSAGGLALVTAPIAAGTGAVAVRAAPAAPTAPAAAAASFGLPAPAAAPAQPGAVVAGALESSIAGAFDGWQPQSRIRLANGQVWQVTDGSEGVYTRRDPKVRISRGSLGSFFMQIDGISQTPRVRRVE